MGDMFYESGDDHFGSLETSTAGAGETVDLGPAETSSTSYAAPTPQIQVFGYQTKNFDLCPGARTEFQGGVDGLNEQIGTLSSSAWGARTKRLAVAAREVDNMLGIKRTALDRGCHMASDLGQMKILAGDAQKSLKAATGKVGVGYAPLHLGTVGGLPACSGTATALSTGGVPLVKAGGMKALFPPQNTAIWVAFGAGAAAGWFSRGKLIWVMGAAGLVWWLNRDKSNTTN
jgi:hypothetical protein